jgi:2-deoxy-D-gluconate 3-dehydrogenase
MNNRKPMTVDLSGMVVIITGAGGIIGTAMSKSFAANGAKIIGAGRTLETLERTKKAVLEAGGEMTVVRADVGKTGDLDNLVNETIKTYGRIDVLINNAGVNTGGRKKIWEFPDDAWQDCLNIDLYGVYYLTKLAARHLIKQGEGGSILNISSVMGVIPAANQCAFAAAKAGLINFTRAIATELGPYNIRANSLCPGSTEWAGSNNFKKSLGENFEKHLAHIPLRRIGTGEDMAGLACFLASKDSSYITGVTHIVDGGWTCNIPRGFEF